jgi:site-specific DNA-methyltransferase (adenine-specific)
MANEFCAKNIRIILGDCHEELGDLTCEALISDPPYSPKTHDGHKSVTRQLNAKKDSNEKRRFIDYPPMTREKVDSFIDLWVPRVYRWVVIMTDHISYPWYREAMERHDRYVFAPVPFVDYGIRPRQCGDGPASWTSWLCVSRPKGKYFAKWRSLPGAYVTKPGKRLTRYVVGGKPLDIMRQIVCDYTNMGDLIVDPFAGGATTLVAAGIEGRKAVGCELDEETFNVSVARLKEYNHRATYFEQQWSKVITSAKPRGEG